MAGLLKRNGIYYALYYVGPKQKRASLRTNSYKIAKAKLAEFEHSLAKGEDSPLPTRSISNKYLSKLCYHIANFSQVDFSVGTTIHT